ncbi:MAG: hypothetical protein LBS46_09195 [Dysgonamonadaceae bacterium]|jgi:esterase/lipase|nr:hypothetical protein [Dysgonamonadaceae bacterium]
MEHLQVTKSIKVLATCVVVLCLAACAPMSKESYLEKYNAFVSEVSDNYKTYDDETWEKQTEKYRKFSDEWYNKFEDKFTLKEQIAIKANQVKWHYYRNLDEAIVTVRQLLDTLDEDEIKKQVQYYLDNNMHSDLQKFYEEVQKAGKDAQEAISEILKELDVEMDELQK